MNETLEETRIKPRKEDAQKYPEINADGFGLACKFGFGPSRAMSGEIGNDGFWVDGSLTLPPHYNENTGVIKLPDGTKIPAFGSPEVVDPAEHAKK